MPHKLYSCTICTVNESTWMIDNRKGCSTEDCPWNFCTNEETPWTKNKDKDWTATNHLVSTKCNKNGNRIRKYCQQSCFDSENGYDIDNCCLTTHSPIKVPYKIPRNFLSERSNLTRSSAPRKKYHCTQVIPQEKIINLHLVVFYQHFQEPKI